MDGMDICVKQFKTKGSSHLFLWGAVHEMCTFMYMHDSVFLVELSFNLVQFNSIQNGLFD